MNLQDVKYVSSGLSTQYDDHSLLITGPLSECIRRVDYFTRVGLLLSNALILGVPVVWFGVSWFCCIALANHSCYYLRFPPFVCIVSLPRLSALRIQCIIDT